MFAPLLLLLLIVPIVELALIVQVAEVINIGPTLVLLIAISIFGAWLLKREGLAAWSRARLALAEGRMPGKEVADGALILFGGALLLTPGFFTDAVGFLCVIPATRVTMKGAFRRLLGVAMLKRMGPAGYVGTKVYQSRAKRRGGPPGAPPGQQAAPYERPEISPGPTPQAPSPDLGSDEDGSPDRG
jgi:UPF0716 protein FxsA